MVRPRLVLHGQRYRGTIHRVARYLFALKGAGSVFFNFIFQRFGRSTNHFPAVAT